MNTWKFPGWVVSIAMLATVLFAQNGWTNNGTDPSRDAVADFSSGSSDWLEQQLTENPFLRDRVWMMEKGCKESSFSSSTFRTGNFNIPVVVHFVHNNGPENLPMSRAIDAISLLNQAFSNSALFDSTQGINTEIEFCLSQRDPQGNSHPGITRTLAPLLTQVQQETDDIPLKSLIQWPSDQYLNIWVVSEVTSQVRGANVTGYASMPYFHGDLRDGIVIEAAHFGNNPIDARFLIQEAGRYLGLYPTYEGGCQNDDCTSDGDRVCDTPPDGSTAAATGYINSCRNDSDDPSANNPFRDIALGGLGDQPDQVQNYMDMGLLNMKVMFTEGQKVRMHSFLTTIRESLQSSEACLAPCPALTAQFVSSATNLLVGATAQFTNSSTGTASSYEWLVNGQPFSTNVDASYIFASAGIYEIELVAHGTSNVCRSVSSETIIVTCDANASFTSNRNTPLPGQQVTFTSTSTGASQLTWLVDGQTAGSQPVLTISFPQIGGHTVQLVASSSNCSDSSRIQYLDVGSCNLPTHTFNWVFGDSVRINWGTGSPLMVATNKMGGFEACASYSDASGELLFYSDGTRIWDRNHNLMPNGLGMMGHRSASQGAIIVPVPGSETKYYLFTTDALENTFFQGMRYSIVDMSLNGGMGDVDPSSKNTFLAGMMSEMTAAIQHPNGTDYWVVGHEAFTNNFHSYLVTASGIQPAVISSVGPALGLASGGMKFSPNRQQLAMSANAFGAMGLMLVDFDEVNGTMSMPRVAPMGPSEQVYGVEFSPDNSRLYFTTLTKLYQIDLTQATPNGIITSKLELANSTALRFLGMQRTIEGEILVATGQFDKLHVIEDPNQLGLACAYQYEGLSLNTRNGMWGLPNFLVAIPKGNTKLEMSGLNSLCAGNGIQQYYAPKTSSSDIINWTVIGNASLAGISGDTLAGFRFETPGFDTLIASRSTGCGTTRDTIVVHVLAVPVVDLGVDTAICNSSVLVLEAGNGPGTYSWSTGEQTASIPVTQAGSYSVEVTSPMGCTSRDTMLVTTLSLAPPTVFLGADTARCDGNVLELDAGAGYSYLWNDGSDQQIYTATTFGTYHVTVTDACGDSAVDTLVYSEAEADLVNLGFDQVICPGDTIVLQAGADFAYIEWQDGSNEQSHVATTPGTYHILVTNNLGCRDRDTLEVSPCVGIEDGSFAGGLEVWPNPANENVQIELEGLNSYEAVSLRLINALGEVLVETLEENPGWALETSWNTNGLPSGMYYVSATQGRKIETRRLNIRH